VIVLFNYEGAEKTLWFPAPVDSECLWAYGGAPCATIDAIPDALGEFNGWSATPEHRLEYQGDGRYQGALFLPAGPTLFKLSTADWDWRVNVGVMGGGSVQLGEPRVLEQTWWREYGVGADVYLDVPEDGMYRFDVVADDPYHPVLTITAVPARRSAAGDGPAARGPVVRS